MSEQPTQAASLLAQPKGGKYLTFELEDTAYGIQVVKVREIIGHMAITRVPRTQEFVLGVMNLRGKIIPVLDLRGMLGLPALEQELETRIIVVEVGTLEVGLVVDRMREVLDILEEEIEDRPPSDESAEAQVVLGIGKPGDKVTILLNIDGLLSTEDIAALRASAPV